MLILLQTEADQEVWLQLNSRPTMMFSKPLINTTSLYIKEELSLLGKIIHHQTSKILVQEDLLIGEETDMAIRITVEIEIAQEVVMVVAVVAPVVLVVVMEEVITDLPCLQPLQELRFLLVTCHSQ